MVLVALLQLVRPLSWYQMGIGEEACSFRSYYADQVRNGVFSASLPANPSAFSMAPLKIGVYERAKEVADEQAPACLLLLYLDQTPLCARAAACFPPLAVSRTGLGFEEREVCEGEKN